MVRQMGHSEGWQMEPRRAATAEPHKRRAVAAGTAVGETVGVGGKQQVETIEKAEGAPEQPWRAGGAAQRARRAAAAGAVCSRSGAAEA
eukprot:83216-Prymnesium_polylepis.1